MMEKKEIARGSAINSSLHATLYVTSTHTRTHIHEPMAKCYGDI